jgi:hypothetical protein
VGNSHGKDTLTEIESLSPDVVLVEEGEGLTEQLLPYLSILEGSRLVCINLADNTLYIYHREERLLTQTADLMAALRKSPFSTG